MPAEVKGIEATFLSLPPAERQMIISHGAALRLSGLRQRLFLAQSQVRRFEEKYRIALPQMMQVGLPDDAGYERHEDYLIAAHWADVASQCAKDLVELEKITSLGLVSDESDYAGE